ncbi:MAG: TrmH family RNA methyltransferase [Candidatus Paceibacterota bacterium]
MQAILHNIRSIYNVASIFRTADGLGVQQLILSGFTPAPVDRFGRDREKFQKVALGSELTVTWQQTDDVFRKITELQDEGVEVLACEPTEAAIDYRTCDSNDNICLVFGSEPDGLPDDVIAACDRVIEIPMQGQKSSLNVSVAFGIISANLIDK